MIHKRYLRAKPGKLADRIEIEYQVFLQRYTPALEQTRQRFVIRNLWAAHLQGGIKEEEHSSAAFNVLFDSIDGGLLIIPGRSGKDKDHAVGRDFRFLQKADRP